MNEGAPGGGAGDAQLLDQKSHWRRRRTRILLLILVLVVGGVVGAWVIVIKALDERLSADDKAKSEWSAYFDGAEGVRNRYVDEINKIFAQTDDQSAAKDNKTVLAALTRATKETAAIKPPERLADAHAALLLALRKQLRGIRKHLDNLAKIGKTVNSNDFFAAAAAIDKINKELDGCVSCNKRVVAAWDKWQRAAIAEGKRLGFTFQGLEA